MSIFRRIISASTAMRSCPQCAILDIARCEQRHHPVEKDQHLGRSRLPAKVSHLRFLGCSPVVFVSNLRALPQKLALLVTPRFWFVGLPVLDAGQLVSRIVTFGIFDVLFR